MIKVAILGYGTIGSGIYEILKENRKIISKKADEEIEVKYVLDLREFPNDDVSKVLVHNYEEIINDPEVKIIAEAMGGINPAYSFAKLAIEKGKSFCTSNKELVAKHGAELLALAKKNNVNFMFEASVGGGIPIIRPFNQSLTPEDIEEVRGILNGTTNYMMTKMSDEGMDFDTVLKDAQDKGYAERNPEADVEGYDACRKIAILSSLASGKQVDFEDIYTEGITKITDSDIKYVKSMGKTIKLLGIYRKEEGKVSAMVSPFIISDESPLFSVKGVFNAISVKGNMLGEVMFYGKGAGKLATASAVVADIIEEARNLNKNLICDWDEDKLEIQPFEKTENVFFVRINKNDISKAKELFDNLEEIDAVIDGEAAFVTEKMSESLFAEKAGKINIINRIRVA